MDRYGPRGFLSFCLLFVHTNLIKVLEDVRNEFHDGVVYMSLFWKFAKKRALYILSKLKYYIYK